MKTVLTLSSQEVAIMNSSIHMLMLSILIKIHINKTKLKDSLLFGHLVFNLVPEHYMTLSGIMSMDGS